MTGEEPTAAYVLSLIGGIFVLIGGVLILAIGGISAPFGGFGVLFLVMGFIGIILGVTIVVGAVEAYNNPEHRSNWGIVIIILSILSIILSAGGLIIGFILSLIGGILFVTWKPTIYTYYGTRSCMNCGSYFPAGYTICPYCGSTASSYPPAYPYYPPPPPSPQQQWPPPPQYPQQYPAQQPVAPPAPPAPIVTPPPAAPPAEQPCPNCGEALPTDIRFCPKCGTRIRE